MRKSCFDCAWLQMEVDGYYRFFACYLGKKVGPILPFTPAPACNKYLEKSGISIWDVANEEEKKNIEEFYRKSPMYNPEITAEEFFRNVDKAVFEFSE